MCCLVWLLATRITQEICVAALPAEGIPKRHRLMPPRVIWGGLSGRRHRVPLRAVGSNFRRNPVTEGGLGRRQWYQPTGRRAVAGEDHPTQLPSARRRGKVGNCYRTEAGRPSLSVTSTSSRRTVSRTVSVRSVSSLRMATSSVTCAVFSTTGTSSVSCTSTVRSSKA